MGHVYQKPFLMSIRKHKIFNLKIKKLYSSFNAIFLLIIPSLESEFSFISSNLFFKFLNFNFINLYLFIYFERVNEHRSRGWGVENKQREKEEGKVESLADSLLSLEPNEGLIAWP